MTWWLAAIGLFGGLLLLLVCGLPAAIGFFGINLVGAWVYLGHGAGIMQLMRDGVSSITNFSLTPIPFFILMGEVLYHTGIGHRAIDALDQFIWRVPGRLSIVAVVAGTLFSTISGSTIAATALLGSALLPQMLRRGYHPSMALGPILAVGSLDMLIPPSALAVLLGSLSKIPVADLLIAGILPGALLSVTFIAYIILRVLHNRALAPSFGHETPLSRWKRWRALLQHVAPLVLIFALVVAAMVAGWATPTEAAAIGAVSTVLAAWMYGALRWSALAEALLGTAKISGVMLFIVVGSTTFAQVLTFSGATQGVLEVVQNAQLSTPLLIAAMILTLLVLGCFLDQVSMMLMCLPFFMPLVTNLGVDQVWFGILFLIGMQLGLLTPPFGILLFVLKSVAPKEITMRQIYQAVTPYIILCLLVLVFVFFFPPIATWLPRVLLG
ncbi:MAG: TRAP transporter large permease subunit [Burkholderiales bacterium]